MDNSNSVTREEFDELKQIVLLMKEYIDSHPVKNVTNEERAEIINKIVNGLSVKIQEQRIVNQKSRLR